MPRFDTDFLDQLASSVTIDITTTGRRSGQASRIEIWWFRVEDRFIITGTPGLRDWYANVLADPHMTVHVNGHDLAAQALPVDDAEFRRAVFTAPHTSWYTTQAELDALVETSPMIEVIFDQE